MNNNVKTIVSLIVANIAYLLAWCFSNKLDYLDSMPLGMAVLLAVAMLSIDIIAVIMLKRYQKIDEAYLRDDKFCALLFYFALICFALGLVIGFISIFIN